MFSDLGQKLLRCVGAGLLLWIGLRYLLPVAVPFLIGTAIALMAEPGARLLQSKCKWPRLAASGFCVSLTLLLLASLLSVLGAIAMRELMQAAKMAPEVGKTVGNGLTVLEDWLLTLADKAPDNLRPMLVQTVLNTFQNGTALIGQVTNRLPSVAANLLSSLSNGALTVGTGVLASFLISCRLPRLRLWLRNRLPQNWNDRVLPGLRRIRKTLTKWLRAQFRLICVTWAIVSVGFLLLGIPYGPAWAALIALVDAVPVLGVGTVLVPWSVVCFLQGQVLRGGGLLLTFGAAWLMRSILEPRLVARSLGLDPLASLAAFYIGFRLWGIPGMILAPMSAALFKTIWTNR